MILCIGFIIYGGVLKKQIIIIGSGPSGLACAHELTTHQHAADIVLLDKNDRPGGLARTYTYKGFTFDIGPHRFYTKSTYVRMLWRSLLGKQLHRVKRLTRVYYRHKFFQYPIEIADILMKFDGYTLLSIVISYISSQIRYARRVPITYRQWIEKKFGYKIFTIFFRDYTEKVWGVNCNNISAKWAQQRIQGLDLFSLIRAVFPFVRKDQNRSLVHEFYYPRHGAGQMYEVWAKSLIKKGVRSHLKAEVKRIFHDDHRITQIHYSQGEIEYQVDPTMVFSSMPITKLVFALSPIPPRMILEAAESLRYRDHITVNLLVKKRNVFADNWIYIHDPSVRMARITNYNNFNPKTTRGNKTALSVEYFVFKDEPLWRLSTNELVRMASRELNAIGLLAPEDICSGFIVKEEDSYPAYYLGYERQFAVIMAYINTFVNLRCIGRGGMYEYNNMDQAILSGSRAAQEFILRKENASDWNSSDEVTYLEKY